ncbi:acyltransferase [Curtobacterium sp. MCLR17_040]|uniref:acyltransferase family protein n=1 Tax=Curtobacterium sp. MCLR17_040 TaxID=2175625 RepID=UPI000DA898E7|nr:acyltransferase [Curtobacterium sp. MCLR17_040]PZF04662.1 acyltransferase [Curtobacterium sp. MCLR17_040]
MSSARAPRLDLAHIDGMRGILAAFVVVAHTVQFTGVAGSVATSMPFVYRVLSAGDLRVPAFIAISGFTMMIAVSGRHDLRLGTSYGAYAKRRIRRLVPPYLAALVLALALIAFVPVMNEPHGTVWDDKLPVTLQGIVTHVFLLHNLSPEWITSINGTLWSLPIEMQLTLLMPVLLLLWRRTHPVVVIVVSFALAVLSIATGVGAWSAPHFLGVFGVGMYGAFLVIGSEDDLRRRRPRAVQRMLRHQRSVLVVALVVLTAAFAQVAAAPGIVHGAVTGTVAGFGITLLLMVLAEGQRTGRVGTHGVRRFLGGRRLVQSGLVSYSVFLVHSPLLALGNLLLLPLGLPTPAQFGLMLFVVAPVVVAVCVVFAVLVERPFMNSHQRALLGELFGRRAVPDAPLIAPAVAPAVPAVPVSGGRRRAAAGATGPRPRRR